MENKVMWRDPETGEEWEAKPEDIYIPDELEIQVITDEQVN